MISTNSIFLINFYPVLIKYSLEIYSWFEAKKYFNNEDKWDTPIMVIDTDDNPFIPVLP